ncbi:MAG: hypothetical protein KGR25_00075 [Chloroflexi bacterium]|nr:hypothetical protein [Chloroflexota bacterium]
MTTKREAWRPYGAMHKGQAAFKHHGVFLTIDAFPESGDQYIKAVVVSTTTLKGERIACFATATQAREWCEKYCEAL